MQEIVVASHNIVSPLGFTSNENYENCVKGISGIKNNISPLPPHDSLYIATIDHKLLADKFSSIGNNDQFTKTEKLLLLSINDTITQSGLSIKDKDLLLIISTTKGNIDLLENTNATKFPSDRVHLWSLANTLQQYYHTYHKPLILSNACISGVNALVCASRLIRDGLYKHILVAGVDITSRFVISGFQSFKAISANACKPFDKNRDGINLGEGCGSILISADSNLSKNQISVLGGSISNDANHISGPSRTGDGLYLAISNALKESKISADNIDLLNAHGTATVYNDEMESRAFKLANLHDTPMNSLKGYFGHTLGAAGTIETIISIQSMMQGEVLPTLGYQEPGTPETVNISNTIRKKNIQYLLKTASGFGGGNGAIVLKKYE